jgi:hypothetical protein
MNMKKILVTCSMLGFLLSGTAYADFVPAKWMWKKDVSDIAPTESGSYVKVHLDREVSFHAKNDLSDLRVAEEGVEIPYQLVTLSEQVRADHMPSTLRDISTRDGVSMFVIDLGVSGVMNDHLRIITDSKNFKRPVAVYASDQGLPVDDPAWRLLTDTGYIYNFHDEKSGFDAGQGEVRYPDNTARYLKVVIGAGEGDSVAVKSAEVMRLSSRESVENVIRPSATIVDNPAKKTTEITADLGGTGIPTHRITLATLDARNFSRRALVLESNDAVNWNSIGEGYLFALDTELFRGDALTLSYRESHSRYIRVLVMNQDDLPISWNQSVSIESTVRAVVFRATLGKRYALYYGNPSAVAPNYDLSRYFQYIESAGLARVTLLSESANEQYVQPAPPVIPYSEKHPNLLSAVLVLLVAMLSFFLLSYVKKLKHSPRGENE